MSDVAITFAVLLGIVVLFVWGRFAVELVALGGALVLWATGVLTLEQSLGGFGDPVVLFGVKDLVVVHANGRILVMPTERAAAMKQLLDAMPPWIRDTEA